MNTLTMKLNQYKLIQLLRACDTLRIMKIEYRGYRRTKITHPNKINISGDRYIIQYITPNDKLKKLVVNGDDL